MADDDVPPLDDMSDLLEQVEALRDQRSASQPHRASQTNRLQSNYSSQSTRSPANINVRNFSSVQPTLHKYPNNVRNYDQGDIGVAAALPMGATGYTHPIEQNNSTVNNLNSATYGSRPKTNHNFAGFKSGFLVNKTSEPCKNDKRVNETRNLTESNLAMSKKTYNKDMPFIKAKQGSFDRGLEFTEVQEAMKANDMLLQSKDSWLTDDLLTRVKNDEFLHECLSDPAYVQAITEMQANPQATVQRYHNNPNMQRFLRDFMKLMGDHFMSLGTKESKSQNTSSNAAVASSKVRNDTHSVNTNLNTNINTNINHMTLNNTNINHTNRSTETVDDSRQIQDLLSDPEILEILKDPHIQRLFEALRTKSDHAQRMLQSADSDLQQKIKKLVDAGLLGFQI